MNQEEDSKGKEMVEVDDNKKQMVEVKNNEVHIDFENREEIEEALPTLKKTKKKVILTKIDEETTDEPNITQERFELLFRFEKFISDNSSVHDIDVIVEMMKQLLEERDKQDKILKYTRKRLADLENELIEQQR